MPDACVATPLDEYALLDFGAGRRLERFGPILVDRPAPGATGHRRLPTWSADWCYTGDRVGSGRWRAARPGAERSWSLRIDGRRMHCRLADAGQVGVYPEHVACWRWLRRRLCVASGARVLNLFAATGGASLAAAEQGAEVVHVDAQQAALELARVNLGDRAVRLIRDDVRSFTARAVRTGRRYELVILDPPGFGRGPKGRVWSLRRDLPELLRCLAGLLSDRPLGIWLSAHSRGWSGEDLSRSLAEALRGPRPRILELGVRAADGRCLAAGAAAVVEYSQRPWQ